MIVVEAFRGKSVAEHPVEIVERKGRGHPDYICDSIMEAISVELSRTYLKELGTILHHNIDKGLLAAGRTEKWFGGGRIIKPMELIIGDRATFTVNGRRLPVDEIAIEVAKKWFKENLRFLDPERINYRVLLEEGSEELRDIFKRPGTVRGANDTSAGVGYYPLSILERIVIDTERFLNSPGFKKRYPETGEDVKVMGLRKGKDINIIVAMPLMAEFITSERMYFVKKEEIYDEIKRFVERRIEKYQIDGDLNIEINYNCLDMQGRGTGGVYLSLTGTSAEDADSGQVGRGNRVNGIISMNRPIGTEASAGKNPVSHVGKIYNVLSHRMARMIYESIGGIKEVYVLLLSRIGTPINSPEMALCQLLLEKSVKLNDVRPAAEEIMRRELSNISRFCLQLAEGRYPVC